MLVQATPFRYNQTAEWLGKRQTKNLGQRNTVLRRVDDKTLAVRYHDTDVVLIHANGTYTLQNGGWQTVTTKARINEYSPARLSQKNSIWYVDDVLFFDGMKVDGDGKPIGKQKSTKAYEKLSSLLTKKIKKYVDGFANHVVEKGLQNPGSGDCWGCSMGVGGIDHLLHYMEESYYVPSLLVNALKARNYRDVGFIWRLIEENAKQGDTELLKEALQYYFRKQRPALLKEMQSK